MKCILLLYKLFDLSSKIYGITQANSSSEDTAKEINEAKYENIQILIEEVP